MHMNLPITLQGQNRSAVTSAMLDSGASTIFINSAFVKRHNVITCQLDSPIPLRNADGTQNTIGHISQEARLQMSVGTHTEDIIASVADIGEDDVILGIDWLRHHNPEIDWTSGTVHFTRCPGSCQGEMPTRPSVCSTKPKVKAMTEVDQIVHKINSVKEVSVAEEEAEVEWMDTPLVLEVTAGHPGEARWAGGRRVQGSARIARISLQDEIRQFWARSTDEPADKDVDTYLVTTNDDFAYKVAASYTDSQAIAEKRATKEGSRPLEELVPDEFREYLPVFSKTASERMPVPRSTSYEASIQSQRSANSVTSALVLIMSKP